VTIDATDVVELSLNVIMDAVDPSFVCSTEELVPWSEVSKIDTGPVEDEIAVISGNSSVVV
jgi:hypothetical protein